MASRKEKLYSILCEVLQFDELSLCWIIADYEQSEFLNELDKMLCSSMYHNYSQNSQTYYEKIETRIHNALFYKQRCFRDDYEIIPSDLKCINKRLKLEHGIKLNMYFDGCKRIFYF